MKIFKNITLGLAISFILCFFFSGITLASWVSEGYTINKITTADLKGELNEIYNQNQIIVPNSNIEKHVWCKNIGETDVLVRVKVSFMWEDGTIEDVVYPNYNTKDWLFKDGYWYYKGYLKPQEETSKLFDYFYLSNEIGNERSGQKGTILVESEYILVSEDVSSFWNISLSELNVDIKTEIKDISSTVTFENPTVGFTFKEDGDLFYSFKNLIAGSNLSRKFKVENKFSENVEIFLFASSVSQEGEIEKIEKLLKDYAKIKITDSNSTILYEGSIWNNENSMKDKLSLGIFSPNENKDYYISIFISTEMPNDYRNLLGKVQWNFLARGTSNDINKPIEDNFKDVISSNNQKTGNSLLITIAPELALISGCIFILLLKKKNGGKNENIK